VGTFPVDEERLPEGLPDEDAEAPEDAEPATDEEAEELARRVGQIYRQLRYLLRSEEVFELDLLEIGTLQPTGVGPAIFRILDGTRLTGSLRADVLRLEGSRAARTLTLVFDGGYEARGGERTPFEGGVRRIVFPFIDPEPWMKDLPELFAAAELFPDHDDGLWPLESVRHELNRLLGLDVSTGWYRVHGIGGIMGDRFVDVLIEHFNKDGFVEERFFADRMRILLEPPGVLLLLEGGAIVRGQEKSAFLEGKYRIFLPRSPLEEWRRAELPGMSDPPVPRDASRRDGG